MEILFATGNKHKADEASEILGSIGVAVKQFGFRHREIRSDSLEEIAREAADAAFEKCRMPVFVEDAGLFIDSLNGFPGTYSAWAQEKIGNEGILRLMAGISDRKASFKSCIAFHDGKTIRTFLGTCEGSISGGMRGSDGFGYDPIFVPEGLDTTFAESIAFKNKLSHRYKSLLEFSKSPALKS